MSEKKPAPPEINKYATDIIKASCQLAATLPDYPEDVLWLAHSIIARAIARRMAQNWSMNTFGGRHGSRFSDGMGHLNVMAEEFQKTIADGIDQFVNLKVVPDEREELVKALFRPGTPLPRDEAPNSE